MADINVTPCDTSGSSITITTGATQKSLTAAVLDAQGYRDESLANKNATNADVVTTNADVVSTNADAITTSNNATASQLRAWEAEASKLTSDSYATEPVGVFVKVYTSDGDGTFTATPTTEYSALHWGTLADTYTKVELDAGQLDTRYYTETELNAGQLDTRYYTETELDAGQLDNRYFTETEVTTSLSTKADLNDASGTGAILVPDGTTAQRPTLTASDAGIRYNTDLATFEGWNNTTWTGVGGGATGGGSDKVFVLNEQTVTTNYTIPTGQNAHSAGKILVDDGVVVAIPDGSRWVIS